MKPSGLPATFALIVDNEVTPSVTLTLLCPNELEIAVAISFNAVLNSAALEAE